MGHPNNVPPGLSSVAVDADKVVARARQRWPDITVTVEAFARFLEAHGMVSDASRDGGAELYLAYACVEGDAAALAVFDASLRTNVARALRPMALDDDVRDEVMQHVRERLLVAEDDAPRLLRYAGQGELSGLIRVMAARAAVSLLRKRKVRRPADADLDAIADVTDDPELAVMKAAYQHAFKTAFAAAVATLDSRDRNFLRMHHLGGMTVQQVGEVYGVHRATATRWLARIRAALLAETRSRLGAELAIDAAELDSVMALIRSRLDVSVERLLASEAR